MLITVPSAVQMPPLTAKSAVAIKEGMRKAKDSTLTDAEFQEGCAHATVNCKVPACARVMVVSGVGGEIAVYENLGKPAWL
jgi:Mrp family chromosome partitioning ATPase